MRGVAGPDWLREGEGGGAGDILIFSQCQMRLQIKTDINSRNAVPCGWPYSRYIFR
jgi:hypothetical protein